MRNVTMALLQASTVTVPIQYIHAHTTLHTDSRICDKTIGIHALTLVSGLLIDKRYHTWLRSIMKVERASEMDSLVWMRVKIWSSMPILAPSQEQSCQCVPETLSDQPALGRSTTVHSKRFSQGRSTLLHNYFSKCSED